MGSKQRLLEWIHAVLSDLDFESAYDPFSGSGCVSYLLKSMGRRVVSSDFLNFPTVFAKATIENNSHRLGFSDTSLVTQRPRRQDIGFVERTFNGVFYSPQDLRFIDTVSRNLGKLEDEYKEALVKGALIRACLKRQPRGVFTISGDLSKYDDGRRDLRLSIEEHFFEQVEILNSVIFSNNKENRAFRSDVFDGRVPSTDLVYLDPPYVPRADDNCYVKRYHFLEGLSCYWQGLTIDYSTKVKKIPKKYTPFSYRKTAVEAFDTMFKRFRKQIIVLSYSSNGYPDRDLIEKLMSKHKKSIKTFQKAHRYHFGTHSNANRSVVNEYLIVGA